MCAVSVSSVCSTNLGLSLPSLTGQLLQDTNWDLFPWAFCRSGEQGNALLLSPGLCCPSLTLQLLGARVLLLLFSAVMGWVSRAQCHAPLLTAPIPPSDRAPLGKQGPYFLGTGCSCCLCHWCGKSCASGSCAPELVTPHPSVGALGVQKHFTLQSRVSRVVGVAGREVQGAALFQL